MKDKKRIISIILLGVSLLLASLVYLIPSFSWIDNTILDVFSRLRYPLITNLFLIFTTFGDFITIVILLFLSLIFIKKPKKCLVLVSSVSLVALINQLLKHLIKRPRPEIFFHITENGYSFPSGHSMASAFFYGFLLLIILNSDLSDKNKKIAKFILIPLIILIGLSRIYFHVHYPSDVIAGLSLGMLLVIIIWPLYKKISIKE